LPSPLKGAPPCPSPWIPPETERCGASCPGKIQPRLQHPNRVPAGATMWQGRGDHTHRHAEEQREIPGESVRGVPATGNYPFRAN
jgi:hypothetical protein